MKGILGVFGRLVGPAALTAAGMIGAGAVATRLLAGAWFGFDLLWVALYVVPMVVFTLDSASRVGVLSGGRGGGYKRIERVMTGLLVVILVCFIVVAIKGLLDWHTWPALAAGLVPQIPADIPVVGGTRMRSGFTHVMAIAGQALPPSVFLAYGYLAANSGQTSADIRASFRKTIQNLGVIWGLFSVVVFAVWIAIPALIAPFWQLPSLLKAILAMVGNLLLAPVAVLVILYFVNQPRLGEHRAGTGRNVVLVVTALFALALLVNALVGFFR